VEEIYHTWSMHGGDDKVWVENLVGRQQFQGLSMEERIILKLI
jgi:hypothetical protein